MCSKGINSDNRFIEHLENVSKIVDSWPQWKQDILRVHLIENQIDMPPELNKLIDKHFWELF
jgi:hypothetical protein